MGWRTQQAGSPGAAGALSPHAASLRRFAGAVAAAILVTLLLQLQPLPQAAGRFLAPATAGVVANQCTTGGQPIRGEAMQGCRSMCKLPCGTLQPHRDHPSPPSFHSEPATATEPDPQPLFHPPRIVA